MLRFGLLPTKELDIVDIRIALISYIVSRQRAEPFALRLEDIGIQKDEKTNEQNIKDILKKFAIEPEMIFFQSENIRRYQQFAISLLEQNKAFICTCAYSKEHECMNQCQKNQTQIKADVNNTDTPYVVRLQNSTSSIGISNMPKSDAVSTTDDTRDFVILYSDATATHNFSRACDDMLQDISMVITDQDSSSDSIEQIHITNSLAYTKEIEYAYLPVISTTDNKSSIKWMLEMGFLPDAIINYAIQLGVETKDDIFTLPDAIGWFKLEQITEVKNKFEIEKLRSINRKHLLQMNDKKLSMLFGFADPSIGKLAKIYLREFSTINELRGKIEAIFTPKKLDHKLKSSMKIVSSIIMDAPIFDNLQQLEEYLQKQSKIDMKELEKIVALLVTGSSDYLYLGEIYLQIKPYITEIVKIEE